MKQNQQKAKVKSFSAYYIRNKSNDSKQLWKGVNLIRDKGSKTTNITSLEVRKTLLQVIRILLKLLIPFL